VDERGAAETEKPGGAGAVGDGALEARGLSDMPKRAAAISARSKEVLPDRVFQAAAVASAAGEPLDICNQSASPAAASVEEGQPVEDLPQRRKKNRISWNFEE